MPYFNPTTGNLNFGNMQPGEREATADEIAAQKAAIAWLDYQADAQAILDFNDGVATRCVKAGVAYPAEWHAQDAAARVIMRATSGDPTQLLPPRPTTFPPGT